MRSLIGCLAFSASLLVAPHARSDESVRKIEFKVADGQVATVAVTDRGPLPAENDVFRVDSAGFGLQRAQDNALPPRLRWVFGLTLKVDASVQSVLVEEVWPAKTPRTYVQDQAPALKGRTWTALSEFVDATAATTPWLFTEDLTLFIFKFTLTRSSQPPLVLYQAATFNVASKKASVAREP